MMVVFGSAALAQSSDPLAPLPDVEPRPAAVAQPARPLVLSGVNTGFEGYKARLAYLARTAGVREATIAAVLPYLRINNTAIRLDRAQPGQINNPYATPPFAPYRRRHVTSDLI